VGDNSSKLRTVLLQALQRSSFIILSGGLGPTKDDLTKKVVAEALEKKMVIHKPTLASLKKRYEKRGIALSKNNYSMAMCPPDAQVLPNPLGAAPGLIIPHKEKQIILLPGVPSELKAIVEDELIPYLLKQKEKNYVIKKQVLKVWGLPESAVGEQLEDLMEENQNPKVGLRAKIEGIEISIVARAGTPLTAEQLIETTESEIRKRLGDDIYGTGDTTMEKVVGMLLSIKKKTVAIAESLTGGLISSLITNIPGSSNYFKEARITYSNESKVALLEIPEELIKKHGAVSKEVGEEMAKNIRRIAGTDIGLSATGIAGPGGGDSKKPVGLVFVGISTEEEVKVEKYQFMGTRAMAKKRTALATLDMLRRYLIAR